MAISPDCKSDTLRNTEGSSPSLSTNIFNMNCLNCGYNWKEERTSSMRTSRECPTCKSRKLRKDWFTYA